MNVADTGTILLNINEYEDFFNEIYHPTEEYMIWRDKKFQEINESVSIHIDGKNWSAELKNFDLSFVDDIAKEYFTL